MKIIVAGGRDFQYTDLHLSAVRYVLRDIPNQEIEWVCGMAKGADQIAVDLYEGGMGEELHEFPAMWDDLEAEGAWVAYSSDGRAYNKVAGTLRNTQMAEFVGNEGMLIAFWDTKSKGTGHMISESYRVKMKVEIFKYGNT